MTILETQQRFLESDEGVHAKHELQRMESNTDYNTLPYYNSTLGRDLTFIERHMKYLCEHQAVNPGHYLSNLKLMTRIKK